MINRNFGVQLAVTLGLLVAGPAVCPRSVRGADPVGAITLGPRDACVTPITNRQARADGGIIDVQLTSPTVLVATLTGTTAANAILGCESTASQTFHLRQEFVVAGPEAGGEVTMTLESTLVGLCRSRRKAGAAARLASAKICPLGAPDSPLVVVHPPFEVGSDGARLCNQRLEPIKVPTMPTGHYVLTADFVLFAAASGLTDAHSAADFSPSTTLPADWVRNRDPFQGVDKKDFGFRILLTVEPTGTPATAALLTPRTTDPAIKAATLPASRGPIGVRRVAITGLDRHTNPR